MTDNNNLNEFSQFEEQVEKPVDWKSLVMQYIVYWPWIAGCAVVALVLIAAGNQLPKLRRNSVSGARTKYSLSSDEAWYKTQRYVGRALMLAGATLLIVTLMPFITAGMACAATLAALVVVCAAALNYRG